MSDLGWLTARPIAHRGLHDAAAAVVENTQSAVAAAIEHGYAIEVDLQLSADGEAMVFHDDTLERLTEASGEVSALSARDLKAVRFRETRDRMQTLPELLEQVAGRVVLVLELKSRWSGDTTLARRTTDVLDAYQGPVAIMSFDPVSVAALRRFAPHLVRGIVGCRFETPRDWPALSAWQRFRLRWLSHIAQTRPHFLSYDIKGLRSVVPRVARLTGCPLITWTVRNETDAALAAEWADQITFEGFLPAIG